MAGQARREGRVRRKPELSQHFIKSDAAARRLVALAEIEPRDLVVEAGPGNGALTQPLAERASRVIAIEADRTLYKRLCGRFADTPNVTLRSGDFLRFNLPAGRYTFFANIPYTRTADIMRKLVFSQTPPQDAYIVMESVAATRFIGQPFGPESAFSLMLKARFRPSLLAWLSPNSFSPPPSVNSAMLRLKASNGEAIPTAKLRHFDQFARTVFASQRRSVQNLIRTLLPRPVAKSLTAELGFPVTSAPSDVSFEHWLTVFKLLEQTKS